MKAYWSRLFVHGGAVYLLGVSQQYGSIVIRRGDDGGFRWTHPKDADSGPLFPGGPFKVAPNFPCAPVAVLDHEGRIYKAFEDCDPCVWGTGFRACVISAPVDADLLRASSWRMSNKLPFTPSWTPAAWRPVTQPGWREGNVAAAPDGQLWNVLTFEARPLAQDTAAMVRIDDEGERVSFDPGANPDPAAPGGPGGFVAFPGAKAKFTLRRDPVTGTYLTLANAVTDPDWLVSTWQATQPPGEGLNKHPRQRNVVWLCASAPPTAARATSTTPTASCSAASRRSAPSPREPRLRRRSRPIPSFGPDRIVPMRSVPDTGSPAPSAPIVGARRQLSGSRRVPPAL